MLNAAEDRKKNKATGTAFHCNSSNTHILSQDCSPEMKDAVRCYPIHFVIHFVSNQMLRRVERCPTLSHASADYQLSLSLRFFSWWAFVCNLHLKGMEIAEDHAAQAASPKGDQC